MFSLKKAALQSSTLVVLWLLGLAAVVAAPNVATATISGSIAKARAANPACSGASRACITSPAFWTESSLLVAPSPTFKTLLPREQIVQSPFLARSASSNQQGIDLSYSNTVDSFHQVAGAGITFTFLKASEGVSIQDTNFAGYRQRAESVGLTVGMYHILSPGVDASTQLQNYLSVIGTVKAGEQACLIDIEPDDGWFQLDPSIRLARILHFANDCHQATGATPAIYISPDIAGSYIVDTTGLNAYQLWLTEWTSDPTPVLMSPWTTWRYWQYSDSGIVPGVEDSVDLDLSNGTLSASAQGP